MHPWTVVVRPGTVGVLAPLLEAHAARGAVRIVRADDPDRAWASAAARAGTLLVVGAPHRGPRAVLPGLVLPGTGVVLGRVLDDAGLPAWVAAAATAARRDGPLGPVALLGGREARVGRALDAAQRTAPTPVLRWDARRVGGPALAAALAAGPALAVYLGHGAPGGWTGYGGVGARVSAVPGAVLPAVVSLACSTASRARGRSFADALLATGRVAAVLGAPGRVRHADDALALQALLAALADGAPAPPLADLLRRAGLPPAVLRAQRLHGDPAVPLAAAPGARGACAAVLAPAPDGPPPALLAC